MAYYIIPSIGNSCAARICESGDCGNKDCNRGCREYHEDARKVCTLCEKPMGYGTKAHINKDERNEVFLTHEDCHTGQQQIHPPAPRDLDRYTSPSQAA